MQAIVIVALCLIAVVLLWTSREHLTPIGNVVAPAGELQSGYRKYTPDQQETIFRAMPESTTQFMMTPYQGGNLSQDEIRAKAKEDTAWMIAIFYKDVYEPATAPITVADVDRWIQKNRLEEFPEYRKMMETYFVYGGQPSQASPPPPRPSSSSEPSSPEPQPLPSSTSTSPAPEPQPPSSTSTPSAPAAQPPSSASSPSPAETSSSTPQPVQTMNVRAPTTITINVRS